MTEQHFDYVREEIANYRETNNLDGLDIVFRSDTDGENVPGVLSHILKNDYSLVECAFDDEIVEISSEETLPESGFMGAYDDGEYLYIPPDPPLVFGRNWLKSYGSDKYWIIR